MSNFDRFYQRAAQWGASPTLILALKFFRSDVPMPYPLRAVDLGCGEGRDTEALLKAGFEVVAVDGDRQAIALLKQRAAGLSRDERDRLTIQQADFAAAEWSEVELVNAQAALPFCPPAEFPSVWQTIVDSIRPGGRFVGSFFGDRRTGPIGTFALSGEEVFAMFDQFTRMDRFFEEEYDQLNMHNVSVHWHVLRALATK